MDKITCQEASKLTGISLRRIQQMCKENKIYGTEKVGKSWMIPYDFVSISNPNNIVSFKKKPLPIGIANYKETVSNYYYVDKTMLIKDFLDEIPKVSLFTRPRRFGKTLTMDMLRVFFEKTNEDTSVYFADKKIWSCGKQYRDYQGKYPVIYLTFKDLKCLTWEDTYDKMKKLISLEFRRHEELKDSDKLNSRDLEQYNKFATEQGSSIDYEMGFQILSMMLCKHYKKECVIIIDEYDTPIQQGYNQGFYENVIGFMTNFFSGGLKDNSYLAFGFMTGILRVAKESIFSGLNNIKINSVLDEDYSQYFGFTKEEVKEILQYYEVEEKFGEVCEWYDGYKFGSTEIFNPWSVINYVTQKCIPQAFWQSTGNNEVIGEIIANASVETTKNLHKLLVGEKVTTYIDTNIVYSEIHNTSYSIYSFLLLAGYLKVEKVYPQNDGSYMCDVAIPNKETSFVYKKGILDRTGKNSIAIELQQAIFEHDVNRIQKCLEKFLMESVSSYDGANESFYHGMMLGLCAVVGTKYKITSNRESGYGRFDIELSPANKNDPAFIFELKNVKDEKELEIASQKALEQIEQNCYDTEIKSNGAKNIMKIGIAFYGKKTSVKSKN